MDRKDYEKLNIQNLFEELDKIIEDMESGDFSLEESFENYKTGTQILDICKNKLGAIESELEVLGANNSAENSVDEDSFDD